jgi:hypothetical protein
MMSDKEYPCIRCEKDLGGNYIDLAGNIVCLECFEELEELFLEHLKGEVYMFFGVIHVIQKD